MCGRSPLVAEGVSMTSRTLVAAMAALGTLFVMGIGLAVINFAQKDQRVIGVILLAFVVFTGVWVYDWYTDLPEDQK